MERRKDRHAPSRDQHTPEHADADRPHNHVAGVARFITIGGTAGLDPATGRLAGDDVGSQTTQILDSFAVMFATVGSDLEHFVHVNILWHGWATSTP